MTATKSTLGLAKQALRRAVIALPHLAGLAYLVRIEVDDRVHSMGICPSGRLLVNRKWFSTLDPIEATFVAAHELMHLALRSHDRCSGAERKAFNRAHDYIINDMLRVELNQKVPAGGLEYRGARHLSVENLMVRRARSEKAGSWQFIEKNPAPEGALGDLSDTLIKAGLVPAESAHEALDVLPEELEKEWFPDESPKEIEKAASKIRKMSVQSAGLKRFMAEVQMGLQMSQKGSEAGEGEYAVDIINTAYCPPWEAALQQWMEAVAPGPRTYSKPSRRGADRTDCVLPGRKREGWTLHIVLDTSGSMFDEHARILGLIASFCDALQVADIHLIQCDTEVAKDQWLTPQDLYHFEVRGLGGSDMSPGMLSLAEDSEVQAALVITDGYIDYPKKPMPYDVLWVLTNNSYYFKPNYGRVVHSQWHVRDG